MTVQEGDLVRTTVALVSDDGRAVPAGTEAAVSEVIGDVLELDIKLGESFDTTRARLSQVEPTAVR